MNLTEAQITCILNIFINKMQNIITKIDRRTQIKINVEYLI